LLSAAGHAPRHRGDAQGGIAMKARHGMVGIALALVARGALAQPAPIGEAVYELEHFVFGAGEGSEFMNTDWQGSGTLLVSADEGDAVDGEVTLRTELGDDPISGTGSILHALVDSYGHTFAGIAYSPPRDSELHLDGWRGTAAVVHVYQSYVKDSADAVLTFTYVGGTLQLVWRAPDAPRPPGGWDFQARARWAYDVWKHDASDEPVTHEEQTAVLFHDGATWRSYVYQLLPPPNAELWPWSCLHCDAPEIHGNASLEMSRWTRAVDLSAIDVGEEFTVVYQLEVIAHDATHTFSKAMAWSRDPLGGSGGAAEDADVTFAIAGLTPTNAPVIASPEPSSVAASLAAVAAVVARVARRSATSLTT
jgi:hypothetical protein